MSLIYSKLTQLLNRITEEFRNSLIFGKLFSIMIFIENEWVNGYLKSFYPGENFLSFFEKNNILKNHIFNPLIVLVLFTGFLALSSHIFSRSLAETIIIAFVFFFIGSAVLPRFILNNDIDILILKRKDIYSIGFCLLLTSITFFIISIAYVGGLPILKPSLRFLLKPALTMPVFLIIPATCLLASVFLKDFKDKTITRSQARFRFLLLLILNVLILLILGYRTPILAALLVLTIIAYIGGIVTVWEVLFAGLVGVGAIMGIGYFRSIEEYGMSRSINPIYTLQSRADFTLNVLNQLDILGGKYGMTHGRILANSIPGSGIGPRRIVGSLISWRSEVTVTSTLLGQMVADFGKVGVAVEMLILGFILGIGFKIMKKTKNFFYIGLYSLILTYSIIGIETGILDIQVLTYFAIAVFVYSLLFYYKLYNKLINGYIYLNAKVNKISVSIYELIVKYSIKLK